MLRQCFILFYCSLFIGRIHTQGQDGKDIVYNSTAVDWATAGRSCDILGQSGSRDLQNIQLLSVPSGTMGWIGAIKQYTRWIKLIGCSSVYTTLLSSYVRTAHSPNSVASCANACNGYSRYGLSENHCYCFTTFPTGTSTACSQKVCPDTQDFCGASSSTSYTDLVLYEIATTITAATTGGECMASSLSRYVWTNDDDDSVISYSVNHTAFPCSQNMPYYGCKYVNPAGYYVWSFSSGNYSNGSWPMAVNLCKSYGVTIADTYDLRSSSGTYYSNTVGSFVWIGIFRRETQIWNNTIPSFNANMNTRCMAAEVGSDGKLSTSTRTCSDQLPFFCELQQSTDGGNIQDPASALAAGVPVSVIVVVVMLLLVTAVLSVTIFILRKRLKRHIYIGRTNNDVSESDTSSTFSRRTLVGQDYAEAEDIRRSRFLSTRSYDTTEQELGTDGYNHLVHEQNQSNLPMPTGKDEPTYNEMDFKKLKLAQNDDAGLYSRVGEENSYDLLQRNKTSENCPPGFEQYDHIASNRDPDKM